MQLNARLGKRLVLAFRRMPTLRLWGEAGVMLAVFLLAAVPWGLRCGLLKPASTTDSPAHLLAVAVIALFVPSLLEETFYRVLLLPHPIERAEPTSISAWLVLSVVLFTLGHPLIAWLFVPAARELFYDPHFLVLAAAFGVVTGAAYLRTGSVWPPVAMHWLVVFFWKVAFGGWIMAVGLSS